MAHMEPTEPLREEREAVRSFGLKMMERELTSGTGGNISARNEEDLIAISPSGIPYEDITIEDVPIVDLSGEPQVGDRKPSSEMPMHLQVLRRRDDVGGIVHTHSPYATTFAALDRPIVPTHYLVAFGGTEIPVAEYATYGTEELGRKAAECLGDEYDACLLQNHGVLAVGPSVKEAFETALMVEYSARIQYQAESIGDPIVLPKDEIKHVRDRFRDYGQSQHTDS